MEKLYFDTRTNDSFVRETYGLSEELMMENAAAAMENAIKSNIDLNRKFLERPAILILCGTGNNGGDGYTLARRMNGHNFSVTILEFGEPKSSISKIQKNRAEKCGVNFIDLYSLDDFLENKSFDLVCIADCIFGTGFHGELACDYSAVLEVINKEECFKIACDVPSGIDKNGNCSKNSFIADVTVTMGAKKICLYSNDAKDLCGKIICTNLGVDYNNFSNETFLKPDAFLLEENDAKLPERKKQNVHKGNFGHGVFIKGEKPGASILASMAAAKFGTGLVTILGKTENLPPYLMSSEEYPENTSAVGIGMGLGRNNLEQYFDYLFKTKIPCVLDADAFYFSNISKLLEEYSSSNSKMILTPHPKEFVQILKICGFGDWTVSDAIKNRIELAENFCKKFPEIVLILKGASTLICTKFKSEDKIRLYFNTLGTNALSKGGSGDVLTGLCTALLAQNYSVLNAAVTASIAHSTASKNLDYTSTAIDLINSL